MFQRIRQKGASSPSVSNTYRGDTQSVLQADYGNGDSAPNVLEESGAMPRCWRFPDALRERENSFWNRDFRAPNARKAVSENIILD
jgi:hypothetical protein